MVELIRMIKGVWLYNLLNPQNTIFSAELNPTLSKLIDEPRDLSPRRKHDRHVALKKDSKPVCVDRYRDPYFQKKKLKINTGNAN